MRSRREIEQIALQLIRRHKITTPPIPIDAIATSEGLRIVEAPFPGEISGALIRSGGTSGIAVNGAQHKNRQRFTIGHELAHHLLDHKGEQDHLDWKFTILRRDGKSSEGSDTDEMEANFLAASLLMPKDLLRQDLTILADSNGELDLQPQQIQTLAKRYLVSEKAMTYRLINLGFISPI